MTLRVNESCRAATRVDHVGLGIEAFRGQELDWACSRPRIFSSIRLLINNRFSTVTNKGNPTVYLKLV